MLQTKTYQPPIASDIVPRQRLFDLLDSGLGKSLILVSAPAGYGKTTLISAWLSQVHAPVAWLSLDPADNDPVRFMRALLAALDPLLPSAVRELEEQLSIGLPVQPGELISRLANELFSVSTPAFLVFDDFHCLHSPIVLKMVQTLLEHNLPLLHIVIATRADPPFALVRLRARGLLAEIRAGELSFTPSEAEDFFSRPGCPLLTPPDLNAMHSRTEGWAVGLRLASLSLRACPDAHAFVSAFTGSHRYIMDYLFEEVLKTQPERIKSFLLQTSILERLNADLCDAVVTREEPVDALAADILPELERLNLFLIPLDNCQEWYRYHALFADVLQHHLQRQIPGLLTGLHRRASAWYQEHGFLTDAVRHAFLAGDKALAARLIEENGCFVLIAGETATLLEWLDAIPFEPEAHPWLAIQKAWALALAGQSQKCEETLTVPAALLSALPDSVEIRTMLGTIAAARAYCAAALPNPALAVSFARQALDLLPDANDLSRSLRSVATFILGNASLLNGDLEQAASAFDAAIAIGRQAGNLNMVVIASCSLAEVLIEQGQLHGAFDLYQRTLLLTLRPDGERSPLAARIYVGLGRLDYQFNRLAEADQALRHALQISQAQGEIGVEAEANLILVCVARTQSDEAEAQKAMYAAERIIHAAGASLPAHQIQALQSHLARLWLRQEHPEKTGQYVKKNRLSAGDEIPFTREADYFLLLRTFLARHSHDGALKLSARLLRQAESGGRVNRVIELLIMQALIYQEKKDLERALPVLEKAALLAAPEGYCRSFLDEGQPMLRLLFQLKFRRPCQEFAAGLIAAFGEPAKTGHRDMRVLFEPLTTRELEVIHLIEGGRSNQEIAEKLVISLATVKRHISNIYAKLGVKSRTQALSIGRELKLFE